MIEVPERIEQIATAVAYDLNYGPLYIDRDATEVYSVDCTQLDELEHPVLLYTSKLADELREFIDALPSDVWVECGSNVLYTQPEPLFNDETEEWDDPYWEDYVHYSHRELVEKLLGPTIAREFR